MVQGDLDQKNTSPLWDRHRTLGIILVYMQGPMEGQFLMSEVSLHPCKSLLHTLGAAQAGRGRHAHSSRGVPLLLKCLKKRSYSAESVPCPDMGGCTGIPRPEKKRPPPYDPPATLGIGLREGPRGGRFLIISEVPL